jgi:hypothetical protein
VLNTERPSTLLTDLREIDAIDVLHYNIVAAITIFTKFKQLRYWDNYIFNNKLQCAGLIIETLGTPSPASYTTLNNTKRLALSKAILGCDILFTPNVFNLEQLAISSFKRI